VNQDDIRFLNLFYQLLYCVSVTRERFDTSAYRKTYASLLSISLGRPSPGNRLRPSKDPKPRSISPSWVLTGSWWGSAIISAV